MSLVCPIEVTLNERSRIVMRHADRILLRPAGTDHVTRPARHRSHISRTMTLHINEIGVRFAVANSTSAPATPAPSAPATSPAEAAALNEQKVKAVVAEVIDPLRDAQARSR